MQNRRAKFLGLIGSLAVAGSLIGTGLIGAGVSSAAPAGVPDGKCVVSSTDRNATINSLMNHCTSRQILDLFAKAPVGVTPVGRKPLALLPVMHMRGRLASYAGAKAFTQAQSKLGDSLTFGKGPQRQPWVYKNYIIGSDVGAAITMGTSNYDGRPAWKADFRADFLGVPISVHEYRQLTPTVWIARDTTGTERNPVAAKNSGGAMAIG